MVAKKTKSHRVSLRTKYMVQKKVKAHKRKLSKATKKKRGVVHKRRKDPGIPNLFPFKEELLQQIFNSKERIAAEKKQRKEENRKNRLKRLQAAAQEERKTDETPSQLAPAGKKWYFRELRKVIDDADVILFVLDARDPLGCRSREIEKAVISQYSAKTHGPKKIILVLNKIDLVPTGEVAQWMRVMRREHPTICFKASTQSQRRNLGQSKSSSLSSEDAASGKQAVGTDALVQLLKNYSRSLNLKQPITVGVVGYPNVGKSSVINSLLRRKAASTSSTAGHTKTIQPVRLDKDLVLLDSPGVLFANSHNEESLALRNALRIDQLEAPVDVAESIVSRCPTEKLMSIYEVPQFANGNEFLIHLATKRGYFKKGGIPHLDTAARTVLRDWNSGKINYYVPVPSKLLDRLDMDADSGAVQDSKIVNSWSEEFDIDKLLDANAMELEVLDMSSSSRNKNRPTVQLTCRDDSALDSQFETAFELERNVASTVEDDSEMADEDDDDIEDVDTDDESVPQLVAFAPDSTKSSSEPKRKTKRSAESSLPGNAQRNAALRKQQQDARKDARKLKRRKDTSGSSMEDEGDDDAYDFNDAFGQ